MSRHLLFDLIRMERIKLRQQKFKRGKEKMLSLAQHSGDGQTIVPPEEDDDDGMTKPAGCRNTMSFGITQGGWAFMIVYKKNRMSIIVSFLLPLELNKKLHILDLCLEVYRTEFLIKCCTDVFVKF